VRAAERGVALLVLLVMLVVVETAVLLVALALAVEARTARADGLRLRLDALADSALEATLARFAGEDLTGLAPEAFGGGTISSAVAEIEEGRLRVVARAERSGVRREIAAEVVRGPWGWQVVAWRPLPLAPSG
jgi:hypothetical protein